MKYCLWSAEGLSPYTFSDVPVSLHLLRQPGPAGVRIVPGLPHKDDFIVYLTRIRHYMLHSIDRQGPSLLHTTDLFIKQIGTVPLTFKKPYAHFFSQTGGNVQVAKRLYADQFDAVSLMDGFVTKGLVRLNSGSNPDLLRWLSRINTRLTTEYDDRYMPMKVDCNIFVRLLHVRH
jgi:hypothetical protein